jgi:hypothetical protein
MMKRGLKALSVGAVVGVLTLGLAAPASAAQYAASCTTGSYRLDAIGDDNAGFWRLTYRLTNGGNKSNVNITIFEGNTLKWRYNSPDNRQPDTDYVIWPRLGSNGTWHDPNGTVVHAYGTSVGFVAIFDKSWGDPSCNAHTETSDGS